ncbi:MAG: hypothetical protein WC645_02930 [Candidatus Margulisiibacteriota bacterium]
MEWIEQHAVLISIILFILATIFGVSGFLIKHFFFGDQKHITRTFNAGGDVAIGGDVTFGDKIISNKIIVEQKPLKRDIRKHTEKIVSELSKNEPLKYKIYIQGGDSEVRELADQIQGILRAANWNGEILTMLGGYIPDGIILYRDKESVSSEKLLNEIYKTGVKIEGQKEFKAGGINIYIGQNPSKYN